MRCVGYVLIAMVMFSMTPICAAAGITDVTVTRAYLVAEYKLEQSTVTNLTASRKAVAIFVKGIGRTCPNVLSGAPRGAQLDELLLETYFAVALVATEPDRHATIAFVRSAVGLRWSNRKLTGLVRDVARGMLIEVHTEVPKLCSDYRSWVESDHRVIPVRTKLFLREMRRSEPEVRGVAGSEPAQDAVSRLLTLYEGPDTKKLVKQIERLEESFRGPAEEIVFGASAALSKVSGVVS
jgi:hypothetical protein